MATQDHYIRTALRVPADLHADIHTSAAAGNRTFNAELIARLQSSFNFLAGLPPAVRDAVGEVADKKGCTPDAALTDLVLAGQAQGGTVLNIRIAPGMTLKEVRDALSAMADVVPNATNVVLERE